MIEVCDTVEPGDVIALGDIHATWEPFRQFLDWVEGTQAVVVLLGDMLDRGGEDLKVLNEVRKRLEDPETFGLQALYALTGNHERLFLNAAQVDFGPFRTESVEWIKNGGNIRDAWKLVDNHANWVCQLPIYMVIGETLFIHAGVFPGHDPQETLKENRDDDLLWVREPFLKLGPQFGKWNPRLKKVVHGHTPTVFEDYNRENDLGFAPVVTKDRVNIDTGACFDEGFLTAYNVTKNTFKFFRK